MNQKWKTKRKQIDNEPKKLSDKDYMLRTKTKFSGLDDDVNLRVSCEIATSLTEIWMKT